MRMLQVLQRTNTVKAGRTDAEAEASAASWLASNMWFVCVCVFLLLPFLAGC